MFTTPIASCNACGASWAMPRDEPHVCADFEARIRADQTERIVTWLRGSENPQRWITAAAEAIEERFGIAKGERDDP